MGIGASEHIRKSDVSIVGAEGGGAPAQNQVVVQCAVQGAKELHLKNMGDENVTYELLARGRSTVVAGENIAALQVGATDQFAGKLANREVTPGTFTANDAAGAQNVQDDGDGNIVDAAAPATVVGTIDYENGEIDFTWMAAFGGGACTSGYTHTGWISFTVAITGTIASAGGEADIIMLPAGGDNYADGIKGQTYLGLMMYSAGVGSRVKVEAVHTGDDVNFKLVPPRRFRNLNTPQ
jgi:hypothetical protein